MHKPVIPIPFAQTPGGVTADAKFPWSHAGGAEDHPIKMGGFCTWGYPFIAGGFLWKSCSKIWSVFWFVETTWSQRSWGHFHWSEHHTVSHARRRQEWLQVCLQRETILAAGIKHVVDVPYPYVPCMALIFYFERLFSGRLCSEYSIPIGYINWDI